MIWDVSGISIVSSWHPTMLLFWWWAMLVNHLFCSTFGGRAVVPQLVEEW